ncbi:hypothetical protein FB45DRAFT_869056 [Roridomyces roridus]|uniref:Uncharacterized protein n=1 Tax=Roridomyces roridus TaxID=1738132 RepID=A0AAD7FIC1_9AGAR|nr:hypothetical protein FB45DRAFT_869056 [Roridomyces roridus]
MAEAGFECIRELGQPENRKTEKPKNRDFADGATRLRSDVCRLRGTRDVLPPHRDDGRTSLHQRAIFQDPHVAAGPQQPFNLLEERWDHCKVEGRAREKRNNRGPWRGSPALVLSRSVSVSHPFKPHQTSFTTVTDMLLALPSRRALFKYSALPMKFRPISCTEHALTNGESERGDRPMRGDASWIVVGRDGSRSGTSPQHSHQIVGVTVVPTPEFCAGFEPATFSCEGNSQKDLQHSSGTRTLLALWDLTKGAPFFLGTGQNAVVTRLTSGSCCYHVGKWLKQDSNLRPSQYIRDAL